MDVYRLSAVKTKTANTDEYVTDFDKDLAPFLYQYCILDTHFVAGAVYIGMAIQTLKLNTCKRFIKLDQMFIENTLIIGKSTEPNLFLRLSNNVLKISSYNDISKADELHASFIIPQNEVDISSFDQKRWNISDDLIDTFSPSELYHQLNKLGITYGDLFQSLSHLHLAEKFSHATFHKAEVEAPIFQLPAVIYGGFQLLTMHLAHLSIKDSTIYLPVGIGEIICDSDIKGVQKVQSELTKLNSGDEAITLSYFTADGNITLLIKDFIFKSASVSNLINAFSEQLNGKKFTNADSESSKFKLDAISACIEKLKEYKAILESGSEINPHQLYVIISWVIIVWATRVVPLEGIF